ncbi:MAG TPA: AI-2E family transporter [bacterium]|nr:AI-2E family transporter [bacterium]
MVLVVVVAVAFLLWRLRFVLVTVALGAMLAYALMPFVEYAGRLRPWGRPVPRLAVVLAVFLAVALALGLVTRLAMRPVATEAQRFGQNLEQYRDRIGTALTQMQQGLRRSLPAPLVPPVERALDQAETIAFGTATGTLRGAARWISKGFEVLLIPILAFYFLLDLPVLRDELLGFLPAGTRRVVLAAGRRADRIVAGYVRAQLILMLVSGTAVAIGLALLGVRYPLLLGIFAGLSRAIPIIGPVLGAIPIVAIAALQSPGTAVAVLIFFVVVQLAESKIVLPNIIGHELKLHAATILLALLLGNALFGLMGMFLAPPAAAFAKALREMLEPAPDEPVPGSLPEALPAAASARGR